MDLRSTHRWIAVAAAAAVALFAPGSGFGAEAAPVAKDGVAPAANAGASASPSDSGYTLKGGQDRTDLRTLTVEGEDRVHVNIDRPTLALDLNPEAIAGLDFGTAAEVLNRTSPDLTTAYLQASSEARSPYTGRPWLQQFASGAVARFQPDVRGTERWKLTVADSRGGTVAQFSGKGDPPKEITWDGRSLSGEPVMPGITYSYVFEAIDRAGNKRNFVGQGFSLSAYRLDGAGGPVLVFSGQSLTAGADAGAGGYGAGAAASSATPPILLEAASLLNQSSRVSQPIQVTASARSYDQANALARQVTAALSDLTLGDPSRVVPVAHVVPDAPAAGTVRIALGDVPPAAAVGSGSAKRGALPIEPRAKVTSKKKK